MGRVFSHDGFQMSKVCSMLGFRNNSGETKKKFSNTYYTLVEKESC
jgi:hypothetical protein